MTSKKKTVEELNKENSRVYYTLNGKELREALGKKPEDSLDEYKMNLCVPFVIRRDFDENMTDEEWTQFADAIINSSSASAGIDDAIYNYFNRLSEKPIPATEVREPHYLEISTESYEVVKFAITDEQYDTLKKDLDVSGIASTEDLLKIVESGEADYVDAACIERRITDIELDEVQYEADRVRVNGDGKIIK